MSNLNNRIIKQTISEIFPYISPYSLASIYSETLRGQINKSPRINKPKLTCVWRKEHFKDLTSKKNYKFYFIKFPNLLETICPDDLNDNNINIYMERVLLVLNSLFSEKSVIFNKNHAYSILFMWDTIGRFRTVHENILITEVAKYTKDEEYKIKFALKDLIYSGILSCIDSNYKLFKELRL